MSSPAPVSSYTNAAADSASPVQRPATDPLIRCIMGVTGVVWGFFAGACYEKGDFLLAAAFGLPAIALVVIPNLLQSQTPSSNRALEEPVPRTNIRQSQAPSFRVKSEERKVVKAETIPESNRNLINNPDGLLDMVEKSGSDELSACMKNGFFAELVRKCKNGTEAGDQRYIQIIGKIIEKIPPKTMQDVIYQLDSPNLWPQMTPEYFYSPIQENDVPVLNYLIKNHPEMIATKLDNGTWKFKRFPAGGQRIFGHWEFCRDYAENRLNNIRPHQD